jgi:hypothetical protein
MNLAEAEQLLDRIEAAWPDSRWTEQRRDIWLDQLLELDAGTAGTAFVKLMHNEPACPTFATFHSMSSALLTTANEPVARCHWCEGNGWVEVTDARRHGPDCHEPETCACHMVEPCPRCSA